jgi:hypothetical protein
MYDADKTIIFAGLARDIETKIEKNIRNCATLGSFFKSYKIIVFENDSVDKTRTILEKMALENPNILLIDCVGTNGCKFQETKLYDYGIMNENRIDRMAYYRNIYLSVIYKQFPTYDYMCMIDFIELPFGLDSHLCKWKSWDSRDVWTL